MFSLPALADTPTKLSPSALDITPTQAQKAILTREIGRMPLSFESNQGQADSHVRFLTHSDDRTLFLTPSEAVFTMPTPQPRQKAQSSRQKNRKTPGASEKTAWVALRMQMVGANPKATTLTQQPLAGRINYFLGREPGKWHAGVPTFGRVGFQGVYPGIDLVYYGNQRHLEYDFVVAPHADPKQIQLHFSGAEGVHISAAGDLIVRAQGRELRWRRPTVYQQDATGKHAVNAHFQWTTLQNGQTGVRFALGRYDTARAVVIDPVLLSSTLIGGSGNVGNGDIATGIALGTDGSVYIAGSAYSLNFPTTAGAFQTANRAPSDYANVFVSKFNSSGTTLLYSTYLGGNGVGGEQGCGIAVDSSGSAYVTGSTSSANFPTTAGAFQTVYKATATYPSNAFVTKLSPTGTALVYSTFVGGSTYDRATGIAIDSSGDAYIAGYTHSTDFPTTPGTFQRTFHGQANAFVAKLNPLGTALLYSTLLGGSVYDQANAIAIDSSGDAYITGSSSSTDFPTTPGVFQPANRESTESNAFVTKISADGTALLYSTYLGGSDNSGDEAKAIAVDSSGNAYIAGVASSSDFPTTPGAFQTVNEAQLSLNSCGFVTKLNATGAALVYSTYLGGKGNSGAAATGIAIDSSGNAYIVGGTSPAFPTTIGAYQRVSKMSAYTAFVTKLNAAGTALVSSTYLGGSKFSQVNAIALDPVGNVYTTGHTYASDFPTTPGAFQTVNGGVSGNTFNAFLTRLSVNPIFPDFNNDGNTDILLQNSSTGAIVSWFMQGSNWLGGASFSLTPPAGYTLIGAGDFSGDGSTTLVLQSSTTNQVAFWYTGGANNAIISSGNFVTTTPTAGWKVVAIGDFNGDGKSDLVFQNQTTNQVAIWFMNGYLYQGGVLMPYTPPAGWTVAGAGDFNGDGMTDLAFQNQTTGQIALWYMNGPNYAGGTTLATIPAVGWKVVGVGDYNGNGYADLLFQNQTTNQAAVWYLKNGAFAGGALLSTAPPAGWKIVGPR